jgi:hypothetical protein
MNRQAWFQPWVGQPKRNAIRALVFDNWVAEAVSCEAVRCGPSACPKGAGRATVADGLGASVTRAPRRVTESRTGQWKASESGRTRLLNAGVSQPGLALVRHVGLRCEGLLSQSRRAKMESRLERCHSGDIRRQTFDESRAWCRSSVVERHLFGRISKELRKHFGRIQTQASTAGRVEAVGTYLPTSMRAKAA